MMASLYQWRLVAFAVPDAAPGAVSSAAMPRSSDEVVEIALGVHLAAHAEEVSWDARWIEHHEIACPPNVTGVREEVVHLERALAVDTQIGEIEGHPARLGVVRVEVDDDQNDVALRR